MSLKLVVPKTFPAAGPLRIIVDVPKSLLHYFDPAVETDCGPDAFLEEPSNRVKDELARRAIKTCFGADAELPHQIYKTYMGRVNSDEWFFKIWFDCDVPAGEENPPVAAFYCERDPDEDGDPVFIPLLPKSRKGRWKQNNAVLENTASLKRPRSGVVSGV